MSLHKYSTLTPGIGFASLIIGVGEPALAQQQDLIGKLGSNEGVFVDGKTFDIARGTARGDSRPGHKARRQRRSVRAQSSSALAIRSTCRKAGLTHRHRPSRFPRQLGRVLHEGYEGLPR